MTALIVATVVAVLFAIIIVIYILANRAQRKKYTIWAGEHSYSYFPRMPREEMEPFIEPLRVFNLFSEMPSHIMKGKTVTRKARNIKNLLQGTEGEVEVTILDFSVKEVRKGRGKKEIEFDSYGSIIFQSEKLNLPKFSMSMENFAVRMLEKFIDAKDIDFESHPEFSKKYLLQGEDEEAVKALFNNKVLDFFEKNSQHYRGRSIEGEGQVLIIYSNRPNRPAKIGREIQGGLELVRLFSQ